MIDELKTGDKVQIKCTGALFPVDGWVIFASPNGRSLMLGFEAILHGHVGMMPVLQGEDGVYRSLIGNLEVIITR